MTKVVRISNVESGPCSECDSRIDGEKFDISINHYLVEHHYKIEHIGTETIDGPNNEAWHTTVAILSR